MNAYTRIIGGNNIIYRKFGDYCISETDNNTAILCATCHGEFNEENFWAHIKEIHNYPPDMYSVYTPPTNASEEPSFTGDYELLATKQEPTKPAMMDEKPTMYCAAEFLENLVINEPGTETLIHEMPVDMNIKPIIECDDAANEELADAVDEDATASSGLGPVKRPLRQHKYIDVERVASKHLLNGKVLKRIFLQMIQTNNEFKYRINKLNQQVNTLEKDVRRDVKVRHTMKILPDNPYETRDEVLILDDELHKSKEMRDCLHDEALLIHAKNAEVYSRLVWRYVMTDNVSNQFCWRGVVDGDNVVKYPVKDLTIMSVFQDAFREKFPSQPIHYFKERTIVYFNKAQERIKRNRMEKKRPSNMEDVDSCEAYGSAQMSLLKRQRFDNFESNDFPYNGDDDDDEDEDEKDLLQACLDI